MMAAGTKTVVDVTDLFCGGGGSSAGAEMAGMEVAIAANHWQKAIDTHSANFPHVEHFCTDLSAADPRSYPRTTILIGSPSCTAHSNSRGVKRPTDYTLQPSLWEDEMEANDLEAERSRFTMFDMIKFTAYHHYEMVVIENVVEVCAWAHYKRWLREMDDLGYEHQEIFFNSMFAWPTPQSRDRYYCVFWRKGMRKPNLDFRPLAYCQKCGENTCAVQSWKKVGVVNRHGKYGANGQYWYRCERCSSIIQPFYYCAANAIDWSLQSVRIGDRKRPLKPKTIERIQYGLDKYSSNPDQLAPFITLPNDRVPPGKGKPRNIYDPLYTQTGSDKMALTTPPPPPFLLDTEYVHAPNDRTRSTNDPMPTQTGRASIGLATAAIPFISMQRGRTSAHNVLAPLNTVDTGNHHALISTSQSNAFVTSYYGSSNIAHPVTDPIGAVTGKSRHTLVQTSPPPPFLHSYHDRANTVQTVDTAFSVVDGAPRHSLVQPQNIRVEDCYFRMLTPEEVKLAMAFPKHYIMLGTQAVRIKLAGQAVTPPVMEMILKRCAASLG